MTVNKGLFNLMCGIVESEPVKELNKKELEDNVMGFIYSLVQNDWLSFAGYMALARYNEDFARRIRIIMQQYSKDPQGYCSMYIGPKRDINIF